MSLSASHMSLNTTATASSDSDNISVSVRVRPLTSNELSLNHVDSNWKATHNSLSFLGDSNAQYNFDNVFDRDHNNSHVYETVAEKVVLSAMNGINGTIFAYGQTASGKTHTMQGTEESPGVLRLAADQIFDAVSTASEDQTYKIKCSYIEIYNERVRDLLAASSCDSRSLRVRESRDDGFFVEGVVEKECESVEALMNSFQFGESRRHVSGTDMNERSSRSHTVFVIEILSTCGDFSELGTLKGKLSLVDLAGSENVRSAGTTGFHLKETTQINKSLLTLSRVIKTLASKSNGKKTQHVNFRDSELTKILQPSLDGNCQTALICCMTPSDKYLSESTSTLKFASSAKSVKMTKAVVNQVGAVAESVKVYQKKIFSLSTIVKKIKIELENKTSQSLELENTIRSLEEKISKGTESSENFSHMANKLECDKKALQMQIKDLEALSIEQSERRIQLEEEHEKEVARFRSEISALKAAVGTGESELDDLVISKAELENEIRVLKEEHLHSTEQARGARELEMKRLEDSLTCEFEKNLSKLEFDMTSLKIRHEEDSKTKQEEIETLSSKLRLADERVSELTRTIEEMKFALKTSEEKISELNTDKEALIMANAESADGARSELKNKLREAQSELEETKASLRAEHLEATNSLCASHRKETESMIARSDASEAKLLEKHALELDSKNERICKLKESLDSKDVEIADLKAKLSKSESGVWELSTQLANVEISQRTYQASSNERHLLEMETLKVSMEERVDALKAQHAELAWAAEKAHEKRLEEASRKLEEVAENHANATLKWNEKCEAVAAERDAALKEVAIATDKLSKAKAEFKSLSMSAEKNLMATESECEALEAAADSLKKDLEERRQALADARAESQKSSRRVLEVSEELNFERKARARAEEILSKQAASASAAETSLVETRAMLQTAQESLECVKAELRETKSTVKTEIDKLDADVDALEAELSEKTQALREAKDDRDSLRIRVEELVEEKTKSENRVAAEKDQLSRELASATARALELENLSKNQASQLNLYKSEAHDKVNELSERIRSLDETASNLRLREQSAISEKEELLLKARDFEIEITSQIESLKFQLLQANERAEIAVKRAEESETRARTESVSNSSELASLKLELENSRTELNALSAEAEARSAEEDASRERERREWENSVSELKKTHEETLEKTSLKVEELTAELENLQNAKSRAERIFAEESSALETRLEESQKRISELSKHKISTAQVKRIEEMKADYSKLKKDAKKFDKEIRLLEKENLSLMEEIKFLKENNNSVTNNSLEPSKKRTRRAPLASIGNSAVTRSAAPPQGEDLEF